MSPSALSLATRFAKRELRGGLSGFRVFLICLALGVAVIAGIGSLRSAIQTGLSEEGAVLLGGDAELGFTYRRATAEEQAWMEARALARSEIIDFRSMATVGDERALTQVKAVDDAYPLVGTVILSPGLPLEAALAGTGDFPGGVMQRVLADRLGLSVGDEFTLGSQQFVLTALLENEPDAASAGFTLGPRTLVRTEDLAQSGLLQPGTLFSSKYRLTLPPDTDLEQLKTRAEAEYDNSGMRWTDARNGAPGIATFVERLAGFLVLVGLSGLAVGGIGVSAAVRAYLAGKTATIATLRTLGADRRTIFLTYFLQIGALDRKSVV